MAEFYVVHRYTQSVHILLVNHGEAVAVLDPLDSLQMSGLCSLLWLLWLLWHHLNVTLEPLEPVARPILVVFLTSQHLPVDTRFG